MIVRFTFIQPQCLFTQAVDMSSATSGVPIIIIISNTFLFHDIAVSSAIQISPADTTGIHFSVASNADGLLKTTRGSRAGLAISIIIVILWQFPTLPPW